MNSKAKIKSNKVLLVGAGVVNLITAHFLQQAGYDLQIIERSPDPRKMAEWQHYGCSRGGGDARMFSFSEMNCYNEKQSIKQPNPLFRKRVDNLGWNIIPQGSSTDKEEKWISEFETLPTWLAEQYNQEIFSLTQESFLLWEKWKAKDSDLFQKSYLKEGIFRLFSDTNTFQQKASVQAQLGACKRILTAKEIASIHPILEDAVKNGYIAGGIEEIGFTLQVHLFMHLLIDQLQQNGAQFRWNEIGEEIKFDNQRNVIGIQTKNDLLKASHYVISPGAYGSQILNGTNAENMIHGNLGVWLELPNTEPQLENSLKLRRTGHITEAANITVTKDAGGNPIIVLGSGYGYTGVNPNNIDEQLLDKLYLGLIDTAQKYFTKAYQIASKNNSIKNTFKFCVRPWTAKSLGVFEIITTDVNGKCVITGGHNTGGFAQAPSIANAVVAALTGVNHAMHFLYNPNRSSNFSL